MKKHSAIPAAVAAFLALGACGSLDSNVLGGLATGGARALGAGDTFANALGAGVGTFADSSKAARELSPENEYYIGRAVAATITARYKVYDEAPGLQLYLNKICNTIVINSPRPEIFNGYHVGILDTQEINAFASPGGHIFLTRGLIACTATEDELASVIAHEIAHIQLQHGLTAVRNSRYIGAAVSGFAAGAGSAAGGDIRELAGILEDSVAEIINAMVNTGYAREQEYDADSEALALLAAAGYEPSSIVQTLQALGKKQETGSGFGKTHPAPRDRLAQVNKDLDKYHTPETRPYRKARFSIVKQEM